ncbi:MAG: type II toxin-antitoxin system VapC family toxin [Bryobacteraceae bacterium]
MGIADLAAYFFDSSALAKRYHPEIGTSKVDQIVQEASSLIRISRLTVVELTSVLAIKVRTQVIGREDAGLLLRQFHEDIVSERLEVFSIGDQELELAEALISRHAFDRRLRTLDALQIAVAIGLRDQSLIDCFVSADKVLCEVAAAEGFLVLNPENS